jgi:hypothetical protein
MRLHAHGGHETDRNLTVLRRFFPIDAAGGTDAYLSRSFAPFIIDVVCAFAVVIPDGWLIGHRGYGLTRLTSQFAMGTEGIFGVPLDVAATYIVLFTIYGAVLELSGANSACTGEPNVVLSPPVRWVSL